MGKRKSAADWRVFLRGLGRTGNARVAAREAGMDVGTAYDRRIKDDGFALKWAAAVEKHKAREAKKGPLHDPGSRPGRSARAGEELVLRRTKHGDKLVRAAAGRWCAETEAAFFAALGRTGCVRASARAAGISTNALYKRREAYSEFAERWDAVAAQAAEALPELLRAASIASFDPETAAAVKGERLPKVNVDQAIRISRMQEARRGSHGRSLPPARRASEAETTEAIMKQLDVLRRRNIGKGWSETADGSLIPPGWVYAGPADGEHCPA